MPKQLLTMKTLFQFLLVAVFAWVTTTAVVEAKSGKSGKSAKSVKTSPIQLMITEVLVSSADAACSTTQGSLTIRG
jgi:hypothetical protein